MQGIRMLRQYLRCAPAKAAAGSEYCSTLISQDTAIVAKITVELLQSSAY
jgi:hypothetical protein